MCIRDRFLSYHTSVYDAVANAGRIMKETGCTAVKLEGGKNVCPQIEAIVNAQIPVCAHIGLTPQSSNMFGGFRVPVSYTHLDVYKRQLY